MYKEMVQGCVVESLGDDFLVWAGELGKWMPNNKQKQMS